MSFAIASENNKAVKLLVAGEHGLALLTFRRALHSLRQGIHWEGTAKSLTTSSELTLGSFLRIPIASNALSEDNAVSPHNKLCYYFRALWIKCDNHSQSPFDDTLLSVVILFNMALTFHHRGLLIGNESDDRLTKALSIYKMILLIAPQPNEVTNPDCQACLKVLLLAVYSNLGHVSSHFMLTSEASLCRNHIVEFLEGKPNIHCMLNDDEYVVFFLNTATYKGQNETEWAPAA